MLYEMRVYEAVPGKMGALNRRFADHTHELFVKHGFHVVGYWNTLVGDSSKLYYILGWEDMNERGEKFAAFGADPEWQQARETSPSGMAPWWPIFITRSGAQRPTRPCSSPRASPGPTCGVPIAHTWW